MTIEVATYVGDLQPAQPPSTDPRGQGDDHLRLIKQVLQNSFPGLEKAIYFDFYSAKSASFSVVAADLGKIFGVSTAGGAVTATLPGSLGTSDAGWSCRLIKTTTDANPIFVAPATGTLTSGYTAGLATARRCIPGAEFVVRWTGSAWIVGRVNALPIGALVDFNSAALPPGYEWPNGQTLSSSANYPEYNSVNGGLLTLDLRGRTAVTLDNLGGSAAGRLAGGIITGTAVGNTGGSDTRSLSTSNMPSYTPSGSVSSSTSVNGPTPAAVAASAGVNSSGNPQYGNFGGSLAASTSSSFTGSNNGGTSTAFGIMQPSIMCAKLLIVE